VGRATTLVPFQQALQGVVGGKEAGEAGRADGAEALDRRHLHGDPGRGVKGVITASSVPGGIANR
jgi:hypothetical protein